MSHAGRWLALAGALVGLAFLAKMLQAFLVIPALVLVYAVFATVPWHAASSTSSPRPRDWSSRPGGGWAS